MTSGIIFDIRRYSIHDGPGIRTTVFFKGCPLSCRWCHNPEGQIPVVELSFRRNRCIRCKVCIAACAQNALSWSANGPTTDQTKCIRCGSCAAVCVAEARQVIGREMTTDQVMSEIDRDIAFYDESGGGVTFSGGEPLAQPEFLSELLRLCKEKGIHTTLDTVGFAEWACLDRIRGQVDLFLYDLKLMDDSRHAEFTGASNERILANLRTLSDFGHDIVLRVPVIPGVNDDENNIRAIGAFASALPRLKGIELLPYHRMAKNKYERLDKAYPMAETRPPSGERMADVAGLLTRYGLSVGNRRV